MSFGLYSPGTAADVALVDDAALLAALLRTEAAWVQAQADCGLAETHEADEVVAALGAPADYDCARLAAAAGAGGNPVIPWLAAARARVARLPAAHLLHRGLTSQDVMDTALMLVLARVTGTLEARLAESQAHFARLAAEHRDSPCLARTLTQAALPTTAGVKMANWVQNIGHARALLPPPDQLPVQLGGAAGTQAALVQITTPVDSATDPVAGLAAAWAARLGLSAPAVPWQTDRLPVLGWATGLAGVAAAGSRIARDVLTGSRGEIREFLEAGGGGSSAMPQKSNPTVSVLLARNGQEAPGLLSTLAVACGQAVDERPDGSWHAEWPALERLESAALNSAGLLVQLADKLVVNTTAMRDNLLAAGPGVVSERLVHELAGYVTKDQITAAIKQSGTGPESHANLRDALAALMPATQRDRLTALLDPLAYTGRADALVDAALAQVTPARFAVPAPLTAPTAHT